MDSFCVGGGGVEEGQLGYLLTSQLFLLVPFTWNAKEPITGSFRKKECKEMNKEKGIQGLTQGLTVINLPGMLIIHMSPSPTVRHYDYTTLKWNLYKI